MKGHHSTWRAIPIASSEPNNLSGFHADNLIYVIDEAAGINAETFQVIEGSLTKEGNKLIMLGNPTQIAGPFYEAFTRNRKFYTCLTFNSEESPLVSKTYTEKLATKYGKASNVYKVRVLGEFPSSEPDVFIDISSVEGAISREVKPEGEIQLGVDPARFGNNESVICYRKGNHIYPMLAFLGIDTVRLSGEISSLVKKLKKEHSITNRVKVKVDETGIGSGVVDNLQSIADEVGIEVVPVNFGGMCTINGKEDYFNLSSEMWGNLKTNLPAIQLPDDLEMVAQVSNRKYFLDKDGKIRMESKEQMTKRGLPSPDRADALVLCLIDNVRGDIVMEDFSSNEIAYIYDSVEERT